MKVLNNILFVSTVSLVAGTALICNDCKFMAPERCRNFTNVPKRECEEISEDMQLSMSIYPVCVLATRVINNITYFDRMCGVQGGANDTCEFLERKNEADGRGTHFKCIVCDKHLCNGAASNDSSQA